MAATRYRRFLKLCEEWPRDESKKGRDLGTFLRQRVALAFREGENTQISDPEKCDQMYESLVRINNNYYKEKFPRVKDTSFTGVTVEECRLLLSTGSMQQMDEEKKGLWKTLMQRFSSKPPEEGAEKHTEKSIWTYSNKSPKTSPFQDFTGPNLSLDFKVIL
ncbi:ubiquinol-cytochrome-c reductase complex assembly factor 2 isoform X1 [Paramormyrops kingsleyae]|nr:ubiquinol-cytochrome-c reductase complex assembly factor 2 isoform X1 [Paramormyrops kingsleyae]